MNDKSATGPLHWALIGVLTAMLAALLFGGSAGAHAERCTTICRVTPNGSTVCTTVCR